MEVTTNLLSVSDIKFYSLFLTRFLHANDQRFFTKCPCAYFTRYACTTSGHMFEIHYQRISISRVWHLVPGQTFHCLALHEAFCVTGSEDGILRVWPMDFSAVFMEARMCVRVWCVHVCFIGEAGRGKLKTSMFQ